MFSSQQWRTSSLDEGGEELAGRSGGGEIMWRSGGGEVYVGRSGGREVLGSSWPARNWGGVRVSDFCTG